MVEFSIFQNVLFTLFLINLVVLSLYDFKYKAVPDYLLLFAFFSSFFITKFDIFEALQMKKDFDFESYKLAAEVNI